MITAIQKLTRAECWLAEAKTFDEFRQIHDIALAAEAYAKAHKLGLDSENHAREIKLTAARMLGKLCPAEQGKRTDKELVRISDKLPDKQRLSEFRKLAQIKEDEFKKRINDLKEREEKITYPKVLSVAHVSHAKGEKEWYTPPDIIEAARHVMGEIDCDPASSKKANETIKAESYFTAEDDGLLQTWFGRVWMNPPYTQPLITKFAEAVSEKYEKGEIAEACILVNNATETGWFQRMLVLASAICFVQGRVKFLDREGIKGSPLQGQAVIYFGKNAAKFYATFRKKGAILDGPRKNQK